MLTILPTTLITTANALTFNELNTAEIKGDNYTLEFEITNPTNKTQTLQANIASPTKTKLEYNKTIKPNQIQTIKIQFQDTKKLIGEKYSSEIQIKIGNKTYKKNITLLFQEKKPNQIQLNLAGLATITPIAIELSINLFLTLIAAILLISFLARFIKRVKK